MLPSKALVLILKFGNNILKCTNLLDSFYLLVGLALVKNSTIFENSSHLIAGTGALFINSPVGLPLAIGEYVLAGIISHDDGTISIIYNLQGQKQVYDLAYESKCLQTNSTAIY